MMPERVLNIKEDGWCEGVEHLYSEHFNERPEAAEISLVILHNITLPPGEFATGAVEELFLGTLDTAKDARLSDLKGLRVSSHFFITRKGQIKQFVSCRDRAWHAGVSSFMGHDNCNDFSIGIELEGTDDVPFEDAQYVSLVKLLSAIAKRYPIRFVAAHSDVAPGRKTDPGAHFDWVRLEREKEQFGAPDFPGAAAALARSLRNAKISGTRLA